MPKNKMRTSGFLAILLWSWSIWAQPLPAGRAQDLDFVANQVTKLHPNFFFQLQPATFEQAVSKLQTTGASMTDAEFYLGLANLLAMAGDGHTNLYLTGGAAASIGFQDLPLSFRWLDDGIFVIGASAPYSRALGTRLVEVGGNPIDEVVRRVATVISYGNQQWLHFYVVQYLRVQQVLQGLNLAPVAATTPLTFQTGAGERFTLAVAPGSATQTIAPDSTKGPVPEYLQNTSRNYWYRYSAANRLMYLKYNVCREDPANPMETFAAAFLAVLDSNPVDTLVIDLRGNTGGSDLVIVPLGLGVLARLPALSRNPNFRLYDVIDKGTFSSGQELAMQLKAPVPPEYGLPVDLPKITTVIGEATGSPTNHYGQVTSFRLPASGLSGQYSTTYFPAIDGIAPAPSFLPDIAVEIRSTDYFARHDPVMAAILGRSIGAPPPPSGDAIVVNGAAFRKDQGVAPGSLAAVFGSFGTTPDEVRIDSTSGRLIGAYPTQVNFLVPSDVATGARTVSVRAGGRELASGKVTITPAGPGIFVLNAGDLSQPGAVLNQDYAVNSADKPAAIASVLQIFATGASPTDPAGVKVFASGLPAEVLYSGPSGIPGLWQVNAKVPAGLAGQIPLFLASQGFVSNAVTVWVR